MTIRGSEALTARTAEQNGADRVIPAARPNIAGDRAESHEVPRPMKYQQAFSGSSLVDDPDSASSVGVCAGGFRR